MKYKIVLFFLLCCYGCFAQIIGANRTIYIPYGFHQTHEFKDTTKVVLTEGDKTLVIDRGYDKACYKFHTTKWFRKTNKIKKYPNSVRYFMSDKYIYIEYWIISNRRQILSYKERYDLIK